MKAQEYSLTGNEKFSVWHTAMLMMTDAQLDHDSKARIMKFVKVHNSKFLRVFISNKKYPHFGRFFSEQKS